MGFVITDNIFFGGSPRDIRKLERDFSRFQYQAVILFSELDHPDVARVYHGDDADSFQELNTELSRANSFASLDRRTGRHVCFFACQRPPQDIRRRNYMVGSRDPTLPAVDDRVLVRSLGRFFGLSKDELPAMVVSPNLWRGPVTIIPRISGMDAAGAILRHLVQIARRFNGAVSDSALCAHLAQGLPRTHPPRMFEPQREAAQSIQRLYRGALNLQLPNPHTALREIEATGTALVEEFLALLASSRGGSDSLDEDAWLDLLARFSQEAGFLGLPSMFSIDHERRALPALLLPSWYGEVDPVSQEMTLSALHFERSVTGGFLGDLDQSVLDHSGLLAGLWKTVEREMNLSFIQLARKHRGIQMPRYFAKWDETAKKTATIYSLGEDFQVNGRHPGSAIGGELAMYMLGKGRVFINELVKHESEPFFQDFERLLADVDTNPEAVIQDLLELNRVRRRGSHAESVRAADAYTQRKIIIDGSLLPAMNRVKRELRPSVSSPTEHLAADTRFPSLDELAGSVGSSPVARGSRSRDRPRLRHDLQARTPVERAVELLESVGLKRLVGGGGRGGLAREQLEQSPLELIEHTLDTGFRRLHRKRRRQPGLFDEVQSSDEVESDSGLDEIRSAVASQLAAQARLNLEIVERLLSPHKGPQLRITEALSALDDDVES